MNAVAHYREVAYQAAMARILSDPTHPQRQQLLDILDTAIALDRPVRAVIGLSELTAGLPPVSRGDSGSGDEGAASHRGNAPSSPRLLPSLQDSPERFRGVLGDSGDGEGLAPVPVAANSDDWTPPHGIRRPRNGLMVVP